MTSTGFDLLTTVEQGGCSAKLSPEKLGELLANIPMLKSENILVDIETHDDAGVYQINAETALIVTTDFFPPVCSDGFEFGEIAAANSLSDVYAMGGTPLLTLNLNMFPSASIPLEVLREIILGGQQKVNEAGAFTMGGHTIDDYPPKYGLAVVGTVHPDRLITNAGAKVGQKLVLTKPLGTGVLIAARRMQLAEEEPYRYAIGQMKTLNKAGMEIMQKYNVKGATDITGFGLLGHAMKLADAANVSLQVESARLPAMPQAMELLAEGCIPGGAFRNLNFVKDHIHVAHSCTTEQKMLACDPQTSGGLFMAVDADKAEALVADLIATGIHPQTAIVGEVLERRQQSVYLI